MIRIGTKFSFSDIEEISKQLGVKPTYAKARCEHGKTFLQACPSCEKGFCQDGPYYANLRTMPAKLNGLELVAISDDLCDVVYISSRHQRKVNERRNVCHNSNNLNHSCSCDCKPI